MHTDEIEGTVTDRKDLLRGQKVRVRMGNADLGEGRVDDIASSGEFVWVVFGGAEPRRLFLAEDPAEFQVLPPGR